MKYRLLLSGKSTHYPSTRSHSQIETSTSILLISNIYLKRERLNLKTSNKPKLPTQKTKAYLALLLLPSKSLPLFLLQIFFLDNRQLIRHSLNLRLVFIHLVLIHSQILLHYRHLLILLHQRFFKRSNHPRLL